MPSTRHQTNALLASLIARRLKGSTEAIVSLSANVDQVTACIAAVVDQLRAGGTLYTCGNGGSAAQAMHLAEELIGRYRSNRRPWPAVCLNADPSALTCIANDFGFEQVFSRQCEALLQSGDVLAVLSTSGKSANIINALRTGKSRGATTVGLLGKDGGDALALCDHAIVVPADDSAHIQESHLVVIHLICEAFEVAT